MRFLRPFLVYGAAILVLRIGYLIAGVTSYTSFSNMTFKGILFEVLMALLFLVLPTVFGTYIHQKLSNIKYFGGALSGFLLVVVSSVFVAVMCGGWEWFNQNILGNYSPDNPFVVIVFVLTMGVLFTTPIGMIFGAIFHDYLVQSKSQLKQEIDA